ncbi:HAD-IA family hydrolase [Endozoicomonas sp. Mp262]|uniref:HAD family hydrolase n=1 Tax=Endozoicomonas sp. Mp262 TaxID=2919499 RepID=UPI0021DACE18
MINNYSLIIFDWDGTIVDSVPNIVRALKGAVEDLELPMLDDVAYKGVIGMSLGNAFSHLYPAVQEDQLEKLISAYKEHHHRLEQNASRLFEGVAEGLDKIKATGTAMAVATGKRMAGLQRSMVANGYEGYFKHCCTADHAASKPDPDMLFQILDKLGVSSDRTLMVGDSIHDLAMAANAGIDSVAVTYGAQEAGLLKAHRPVFLADHFDELVSWLGVSSGRLDK